MTTGIILLAHGSRDAQWRQPIEAVALCIKTSQPAIPVRCAYLELCPPSLPEAATELIADGARRLKIVPLFLGLGKHARQDMPQLVEKIRAAHPHIEVELLAAVGESPQLIALIADLALSS